MGVDERVIRGIQMGLLQVPLYRLLLPDLRLKLIDRPEEGEIVARENDITLCMTKPIELRYFWHTRKVDNYDEIARLARDVGANSYTHGDVREIGDGISGVSLVLCRSKMAEVIIRECLL